MTYQLSFCVRLQIDLSFVITYGHGFQSVSYKLLSSVAPDLTAMRILVKSCVCLAQYVCCLKAQKRHPCALICPGLSLHVWVYM